MKRVLFVFLFMIALPLPATDVKTTILYYRISEPGIDPYLSRWLITDQFLRVDEGEADNNFILYNRNTKTVYSIVHSDRTILDIPYLAVTRKPEGKLTMESRTVRDEKLPAVDGKRPIYRELHVNGAHCHSAVSVEKLLPDAVKVMAEYRQVMAGEHAKNMVNTPIELQQPCELAVHVFNPLWLLEKGLPIQEWNTQGKAQALLDYKTGELVEGVLFVLPDGYRHYQTNGGQSIPAR